MSKVKLLRVTLAGAVGAIVFAGGLSAIAGRHGAEVLAAYEKTGDTTNCLRLSWIRDSDPVDDYTIVFEVRGGDVYLNELDSRCSGLEREKRFSYVTPRPQICEGDIISVTDTFGTFRGSCALGKFEKLSKIEN